MAAPTTILEYVTLRRDSAQQDLTNTQTQLAAAQTAVASAITALANETDERVASEAADVVYHLLVGLRARDIAWRRVIEVLAVRAGRSGHAEKASRRR